VAEGTKLWARFRPGNRRSAEKIQRLKGEHRPVGPRAAGAFWTGPAVLLADYSDSGKPGVAKRNRRPTSLCSVFLSGFENDIQQTEKGESVRHP
jgi:hypothetical protein